MERLNYVLRLFGRQVWRALSSPNKQLDDSDALTKIPSFTLFCWNCLDLATLASALVVLCALRLHTWHSTSSYIATLVVTLHLLGVHLCSFRAFVNVKRSSRRLSAKPKLRTQFLQALNVKQATACNDNEQTSQFAWLNQVLRFLWPFLAYSIHKKANAFFKRQRHHKSLRRRNNLGKLVSALVKKLDTDIILIKQFNLGKCAPTIRYITVNTEHSIEQSNRSAGRATQRHCRYLAFNINLEYNGDAQFRIVYRYLLCLMTELGLKDAYFKFNMRFVFGPIVDRAPYFERLEFCMLDLPEFGYHGIALAELAEVKVVRKIINQTIKKNLLYPKTVNVDLQNSMSSTTKHNHDDDDDDKSCSHDDDDDDDDEAKFVVENPCWARLSARLILCGFCCTNCCLRKKC